MEPLSGHTVIKQNEVGGKIECFYTHQRNFAFIQKTFEQERFASKCIVSKGNPKHLQANAEALKCIFYQHKPIIMLHYDSLVAFTVFNHTFGTLYWNQMCTGFRNRGRSPHLTGQFLILFHQPFVLLVHSQNLTDSVSSRLGLKRERDGVHQQLI